MDEKRYATVPRSFGFGAVGLVIAARVQVQAQPVHQRVQFVHDQFRIAEINGDGAQFRRPVGCRLVGNEEHRVGFKVRVLLEALPAAPPPLLLAPFCSWR